MPITLVLGGARSGKSAYAQARAEAQSGRRVMIATAQAHDEEMAARIERHQAERGVGWVTVEAPLALTAALERLSAADVAVVDCLTLWLTNLILADEEVEAAADSLIATLIASSAQVLLVSNEVGWGIVPDNALARRFRDEAGRLHQRIADVADEVVLVVAGLPLWLKTSAPRP